MTQRPKKKVSKRSASPRKALKPSTVEVLLAIAAALKPPDPVDPIKWLEQTRRLSIESSREVGPFRFDRAPYLEEPQRAILDPDVPEVVIDWCSQAGKTEVLLNALLFWSVHAPAPALMVAPDWKSAKSISADRIRPMMRDARLSAEADTEIQVGGPGSDNSAFRMTLAGKMPLTIVHASSASALAQRPVRYLLFDETSRMPTSAKGRGDEGDPIALGKIRQTTFQKDAKTVYVSSPVEEHQCRITDLYEASTRERWHSRCPECDHLQVLRLPEIDFASATCRCLSCGGAFIQDEWQSTRGEWIAENPGVTRRGFWLNFAASPFLRWEVVFEEWKQACHAREEGDESLFRVVLATRLAENFTEKVELMSEPEILLSRAEPYTSEVPEGARILIAALDTQRTWLEYLVVAVGSRGELWCLETGTIDGRIETEAEALYKQVDERLLDRRWKRPNGELMAISRCLQDSGGHATTIVYKFTKERARVMWAYRGTTDITGPWKRGTDSLTHSRLIQGNANYFKESLASKLEIGAPGPGYIHFPTNAPLGFDEEFFLQLLSERREKRKRNGVMTIRWVQMRERNEALDLICMVLCAIETYRGTIDTMSPQIVSAEPVPARSESRYGAQGGIDAYTGDMAPVTSQIVEQRRDSGTRKPVWGVQNQAIGW